MGVVIRTLRPLMTLAFIAAVFAVVFVALQPELAGAQSSVVCEGIDATTNNFCSDDTSTPGVSGILETALNILSVVAGVTATIMFMLGGAKYITSQGDPNSTNSARNTLIYAAIGIVIVIAAQTIVYFAIDQATGDIGSPSTNCTVGPGPC